MHTLRTYTLFIASLVLMPLLTGCPSDDVIMVGDISVHPLVHHHFKVARIFLQDPTAFPGTPSVTIKGKEGTPYPSIGAAVTAASDGDTLVVAPGTYKESIAIAGKALVLEGAGTDKVLVTGETVTVDVLGSESLEIRGMTFVGKPGFPGPVVRCRTSKVTLENVRIMGSNGPAIHLEEDVKGELHLSAVTIMGNLGGGLVVSGGKIRLERVVIAANGRAGLIIGQGNTMPLDLEVDHSTIVDNYHLGTTAVAVTTVDDKKPSGTYVFSYNILHGDVGGGIALPPAPENQFIPPTTSLSSFFVDRDMGMYTPSSLLPYDPNGIEMGAKASVKGEQMLVDNLGQFLDMNKVLIAFKILPYLDPKNQESQLLEIRNRLYKNFSNALVNKLWGMALWELIGAVKFAPADWHIDERMVQCLEQMKPDIGVSFDTSQVLLDKPKLREYFLKIFEQTTAPILSFSDKEGGAVTSSIQVKVVMAGEPTETEEVLPYTKDLNEENPQFTALTKALSIAENRAKKAKKSMQKAELELSSYRQTKKTDASKQSKYEIAMEMKIGKYATEYAQQTSKIKEIKEKLGKVSKQFACAIKGTITKHTSTAAYNVFIQDQQSSQTIYNEKAEFTSEYTVLELEPSPQCNFKGVKKVWGNPATDRWHVKRLMEFILFDTYLGREMKLLEKTLVENPKLFAKPSVLLNSTMSKLVTFSRVLAKAIEAETQHLANKKKLDEVVARPSPSLSIEIVDQSWPTLKIWYPSLHDLLKDENKQLAGRWSMAWDVLNILDEGLEHNRGISAREFVTLVSELW